jgi:hypothetical protein
MKYFGRVMRTPRKEPARAHAPTPPTDEYGGAAALSRFLSPVFRKLIDSGFRRLVMAASWRQ